MDSFGLIGRPAFRLTNVLQGLGDGVLVQGTPLECPPGQALTELPSFSCGDEHIQQQGGITPHR